MDIKKTFPIRKTRVVYEIYERLTTSYEYVFIRIMDISHRSTAESPE